MYIHISTGRKEVTEPALFDSLSESPPDRWDGSRSLEPDIWRWMNGCVRGTGAQRAQPPAGVDRILPLNLWKNTCW
jgi:hypothetical protein